MAGVSRFERHAGIPRNSGAGRDRRCLPSPRSAAFVTDCCAGRGRRTGRARRSRSRIARPLQAVAQIALLPHPRRALPRAGPAQPALSIDAMASWLPGHNRTKWPKPEGRRRKSGRRLALPLPARPLPEPHYRRPASARRSPGAVYACVSAVKVVAKPTPATE